MRVTVEELIAELQQCDPKSPVVFSGGFHPVSGERVERNHLARVDKFAGKVMIVVESGV